MPVTVHANQVPISPRKVRFALGALRGLTVARAIAVLSASPRQTLGPVIKLLRASVSAARDRSPAVTADDLRVSTVFANDGSRLYRGRRRSRGRVSRFAKRSSHLTLTVEWSNQGSRRTTQGTTRTSNGVRPPDGRLGSTPESRRGEAGRALKSTKPAAAAAE